MYYAINCTIMMDTKIAITIPKDSPLIPALKQALDSWGERAIDTGQGVYHVEVLRYTKEPKRKPVKPLPRSTVASRPLSYYDRFLVGSGAEQD